MSIGDDMLNRTPTPESVSETTIVESGAVNEKVDNAVQPYIKAYMCLFGTKLWEIKKPKVGVHPSFSDDELEKVTTKTSQADTQSAKTELKTASVFESFFYKLHIRETREYLDGTIKEGLFTPDGRLFQGKIRYKDGSRFEGKFDAQEDLVEGEKVSSNGTRYKGTFEKGRFISGVIRHQDKTWLQVKSDIERNCYTGKKIFPDGQIQEGDFDLEQEEFIQGSIFFSDGRTEKVVKPNLIKPFFVEKTISNPIGETTIIKGLFHPKDQTRSIAERSLPTGEVQRGILRNTLAKDGSVNYRLMDGISLSKDKKWVTYYLGGWRMLSRSNDVEKRMKEFENCSTKNEQELLEMVIKRSVLDVENPREKNDSWLRLLNTVCPQAIHYTKVGSTIVDNKSIDPEQFERYKKFFQDHERDIPEDLKTEVEAMIRDLSATDESPV